MKKTYINTILLVFMLFIFGIVLGIHLDSNVRMDYDNLSFFNNREMETQEITDLKKTNQEMRERIQSLKSEIETYEREMVNENLALKKLKEDVELYQLMAGHRDAVGKGITITLEGIHGENIALIVEQKKYLIRIINELRNFDAEVLSVNNHRLTARSEVTVAGSHINVNGKPIAPPYKIQAIGDQIIFQRYIEHGTLLFDYMNSDGIKSTIQFEESIQIPAIDREKPIEFLRPIK